MVGSVVLQLIFMYICALPFRDLNLVTADKREGLAVCFVATFPKMADVALAEKPWVCYAKSFPRLKSNPILHIFITMFHNFCVVNKKTHCIYPILKTSCFMLCFFPRFGCMIERITKES